MSLLAAIKARLAPPPVPPKCPACKQDEQPLESAGAGRWFCPSCAKDFAAVLEDGGETWRFDLTPRRYRHRL